MHKHKVYPSNAESDDDDGDMQGDGTFDIDIIDITVKNICYDRKMLEQMTEKMYAMYKKIVKRYNDIPGAYTAKARETAMLRILHEHNGYQLDVLIMAFLKSNEFHACVADIEPFIAPFLQSKLFLYSFLLHFFSPPKSLHVYWKMILRIVQPVKSAQLQFAKDICYLIGLEFSPDFGVMMGASYVTAIQRVCVEFDKCATYVRALNDVSERDLTCVVEEGASTIDPPMLIHDYETKIFDPPPPIILNEEKYLQVRHQSNEPPPEKSDDDDDDDDDEYDELSEMAQIETRSEMSDASTAWSISSTAGYNSKRKIADAKLKTLHSISKLDTDADLTAFIDEMYACTDDDVCKLTPLNYYTKVRTELLPYIKPMCPRHLAYVKTGQLKKLHVLVLLIPYIFEHNIVRHVYNSLRLYKRVNDEHSSVDLTTISGICIYMQFCTETHLLLIISEVNKVRLARCAIKNKV